MRTGKAYLECLPREKSWELWQNTLMSAGYFTDLPTETLPVEQALGRVTAGCTYAKQSVPHYNGSAMDGIAVRAQDTFGATETTPMRLKLLKSHEPFVPGGCYIIDTGDLMPAETNSVIMIEDVHIENASAEIIAAAAPWQHVRIIGEDIVANEMVLPEHQVIRPADIAALLSAGLETVEVVAKPKVTVIPTGTELVARSHDLKPGAILDVNSHMLCAAVTQWGGDAIRHEIVPDNYEQIKQAVIASLATSDMVITNAGTSAGTEDFTSRIFAELGEVLVHGVAIKPGKPVILAFCQGKPVIGLPGYPVSAMLTAELFVKDVLYERQRLPIPAAQQVPAVLARQLSSHVGVEEFVRVSVGTIQGKTVAAPLSRGAGIISSLIKAQGVLVVSERSTGLPAGAMVQINMLNRQQSETVLAVGSHDLALDILGVFLNRRSGKLLSAANVGSMGGIMAVRNNEAHIAGIHMLDDKTGEYNIPFVNKYLTKGNWQLVRLARREQGLMVLPGNPKNIKTLEELGREDITYVNRQRGSGTRMLLDHLVPRTGLRVEHITGYEKEVSTHMAVAATITAGAADTGLGIRAAATALGLEFIPISHECYDILLNFPPGDITAETIITILQTPAFRQEVERLGGYDLAEAGTVLLKM
ncbi:molybdopterin biosynthesis protein [Sporomusa sphaeroides]|jgi:putative molybdopterin biosynthesis protein|uniref:Molybdopterin molybdenumtransferase n=1 Tax=Sporomusa sphaeroides DSM 2875 TaxID=1337886 RepID=A0ABP2C8Z1_9FIRM|nr:molybdopterin biosynthesis protein [Sporomusa sphaeroides]OLS57879.1 molybdopterin molybdenumtransferase [Sporomusa sphaeroides DSM 2875]CVK20392.1 Molybdopterin molybdenumtransferase [Sporomusa sphaeroides DSM 2875]